MPPHSDIVDCRSLLVIHPGALGDVLLAIPALRSLRVTYPNHALALMAGREVSHLLQCCKVVDRAFPLEQTLWRLLAESEDLPSSLRAWLTRCDRVIAWLEDREGQLAKSCASWGIDALVVGSARTAAGEGTHQSEKLLASLGPSCARGIFDPLELPHPVQQKAATLLESYGLSEATWRIGLHPGSGSSYKCLEERRLAEVLAQLRARSATVCLLEGPADASRVAKVLGASADPLPVVRDLDLLSMAGVLAHLDLFIGHDSGLTHLAAALGRPTVALFGPTDAIRWAPRGPDVRIVTGQKCSCQEWEQVRQCPERPCLALSSQSIVDACFRTSSTPEAARRL